MYSQAKMKLQNRAVGLAGQSRSRYEEINNDMDLSDSPEPQDASGAQQQVDIEIPEIIGRQDTNDVDSLTTQSRQMLAPEGSEAPPKSLSNRDVLSDSDVPRSVAFRYIAYERRYLLALVCCLFTFAIGLG
jgi:hypothetical protein